MFSRPYMTGLDMCVCVSAPLSHSDCIVHFELSINQWCDPVLSLGNRADCKPEPHSMTPVNQSLRNTLHHSPSYSGVIYKLLHFFHSLDTHSDSGFGVFQELPRTWNWCMWIMTCKWTEALHSDSAGFSLCPPHHLSLISSSWCDRRGGGSQTVFPHQIYTDRHRVRWVLQVTLLLLIQWYLY